MKIFYKFINKIRWNYLLLVISFVFLWLFGIYKNGIVAFTYHKENYFYLLKIIVIPIIFVGTGYLFDTLLLKKKTFLQKKSIYILSVLSLILPSAISFFGLLLLLLFFLFLIFINEKKNINIILIALFSLFTYMRIFNINFCNQYECIFEKHQSIIDHFLGFDVGSLYASSFLFLLLIGLVLTSFTWFKKQISFYSYICFTVCILCESIYFKNNIFLTVFQPQILFICIFAIPYNLKTPYLLAGQKWFGLFSGLILFLSYYINWLECGLLLIFIMQYFHSFYDNSLIKWKNRGNNTLN